MDMYKKQMYCFVNSERWENRSFKRAKRAFKSRKELKKKWNFVNELTNNEIIESRRARHFESINPADIKDEVNALLEIKSTPALIDEEVREIWLADNTILLVPRKQIRSKERDAARNLLYNRHREEVRIDVEIPRQKL